MEMSSTSSRLMRTGSCVPREARGKFEFLVCDWSLMKREPGEVVVSQEFIMADDSKWTLHIYLGGKTERQAGFLTTEVVLTCLGNKNRDSVVAIIRLSVVFQKGYNAHGSPLGSTSYKSVAASKFRLDDPVRKVWAVDNFMQITELENKYLKNDSILFAVDIEVLGKPAPLRGIMPAYIGSVATLQEDLGTLLGEVGQILSDIIIVVEGKEFHCHKCVLAVRSQFFKQKFLRPTFIPQLILRRGKYPLNNISLLTFEDALRFMYTDACSNDVLAKSSDLLVTLASKLKIPRLITICEDYIGETLTPDRVAAVLNLAVDIQSDRLERCCSDFIAAHINNVLAANTLRELKPQALKNLITRSVIPTSALLVRTGRDYNSPFRSKGRETPLHGQAAAQADEEVKDPMGAANMLMTVKSKPIDLMADSADYRAIEDISDAVETSSGMVDHEEFETGVIGDSQNAMEASEGDTDGSNKATMTECEGPVPL